MNEIYAKVFEAIRDAKVAIMQEVDVAGVIGRISEMPEKIKAQKAIAHEAQCNIKAAKDALAGAEGNIMALITVELAENGKPKFSNDTARKAELLNRIKDDSDYQYALSLYKAADKQASEAQFELDMLQDQFLALQKVSDLLAGTLKMLSGK